MTMVRLRRAFTLLEVVVAAALFGLATTALLATVSHFTEALARVTNAPADDAEIRFVMSVILRQPSAAAVRGGGSCALPDGGRVRWSVDLTETATPDLQRLEVSLWKDERTGPRLIRVKRLAYRPQWSEPVARAEKIRRLKDAAVPMNGGEP